MHQRTSSHQSLDAPVGPVDGDMTPDHRSRLTDHDRPTARVRARPIARATIKYLVTPPNERSWPKNVSIPSTTTHPVGRVGRSVAVGASRGDARARVGHGAARARECATPGRGPRTANSLRERDERDASVSARARARDSRASRLPAIDRSIIRGRAFRDTRRGSLVRSSSGGELNGASRDEGDFARWRAWKNRENASRDSRSRATVAFARGRDGR